MTFDGYESSEFGSQKNSRVAALALLTVAIFAIIDMIEDSISGIELPHLLIEATIIVASLTGSVFLWKNTLKKHAQVTQFLKAEIITSRADAIKWKSESADLVAGLGQAIDRQFERWNLTAAERDIGLLILKGFSHQEIAEIRGRSERTVRQQAASLYQKSKLENRAQLSAFFLEDLLQPFDRNGTPEKGAKT